MLQRIRVAALAFVVGVGSLVLTAGPATAAKAPSISAVTTSPASPIVVFDSAVTVTFTFVTADATRAELQVKPPGPSVWSPVELKSQPVGQRTKWTGTKSFDASNAGKWGILAIAHGQGEKSAKGAFEVVKALDTKIVRFNANPDRVDRGDRIKVSGRLLANGKGYGGQTVAITFRPRGGDYDEVTKVTTSRGGWFSDTVRARATGWWRAEFAATATARGSVSDADRVDVRRGKLDSRIAGFNVRPEPVDKGDKLSISGALRVERRGGVAGQRVAVYFKADGSRRWKYVTSDVTGRHGRFRASATADTSGWWRATYAGNRGVKGSVSSRDWVRVNQKADTRLIRFGAYPEPVKRGQELRFSGRLQVDDDGSWEGYSGRVGLYFKPLGSRTWHYVKSTWASDSGRLYTRSKAWSSGHWRFSFGGDEDTNGSNSRRDFVPVKRR